MDIQSITISNGRRTDRVPVCLPLAISGLDPTGKVFSKHAITTNLNRHGCGIVLKAELGTNQELVLEREGSETKALGRVVCQVGSHSDGNLYGIEFRGTYDNLWGIQFSPSFHESLLNALHEGVYFVNSQRKLTYWNEAATGLSGYAEKDMVGRFCFENILGHVDGAGQSLCRTHCPLSQTIADGRPRESEIFLRHKRGHLVPLSVKVVPLQDSTGRIVGAVEIFKDATAKKRMEARVGELEHLAFRDALTGLPNRRYIEFKLAQALRETEQFGTKYGVLMIDIDHFKEINDTYGHSLGDTTLKTVAETLVRGLRSKEIVGRWGGDEFLILLGDVDAIHMGDLAERCRTMISQSAISAGASVIKVTVSTGGTLLHNFTATEDAIACVDSLMYQSKKAGRDCTTLG